MENTESIRTTKKRKVNPPVQFQANSRWNDREIFCLTLGIQKYGFAELEKISKLIRTRDKNAVQHYISAETTKIRYEIARENGIPIRGNGSWYHPSLKEVKSWPPIRKWRRLMYNQLLPCIKSQDYSKILMEDLLQSFYEEAEESDDLDGPNFKAIYKYLLDSFRGCIPAELSPINSCIVLQLLNKLTEMQKNLDISEEMKFLKTFKKARTFVPMKIKSEFKERTKKRTEILGNNLKIKTLLNEKEGSSSRPSTSYSSVIKSETAMLSNTKPNVLDSNSELTNTPSESFQSIPKSSKLKTEKVKNSSIVPDIASEVTVNTTVESECEASEMEEEASKKDTTEIMEDEENTISLPEEIYTHLSKHRKLVQSFNPLNVPMWCLVTEQAYLQESLERNLHFKSQPNAVTEEGDIQNIFGNFLQFSSQSNADAEQDVQNYCERNLQSEFQPNAVTEEEAIQNVFESMMLFKSL